MFKRSADRRAVKREVNRAVAKAAPIRAKAPVPQDFIAEENEVYGNEEVPKVQPPPSSTLQSMRMVTMKILAPLKTAWLILATHKPLLSSVPQLSHVNQSRSMKSARMILAVC